MKSVLTAIHDAVRGADDPSFGVLLPPSGSSAAGASASDPDTAYSQAYAKASAAETQRCHEALSAPGIKGNADAMWAAMSMLQATREMSGSEVAKFVLDHSLGSTGIEAMADAYERSRLVASYGQPGAAGVARPSYSRGRKTHTDLDAAAVYTKRRADVATQSVEASPSGWEADEQTVSAAEGSSQRQSALPDPSAVFAKRRAATGD